MRLQVADETYDLVPCLDDQEWTRALAPARFTGKARCVRLRAGQLLGRGYLELTGYGEPLRF